MLHHGGFHAQRAAQNKEAQTSRFFSALWGSAFFALALFPMYVPLVLTLIRFPWFGVRHCKVLHANILGSSLAAGTLALKITVDAETVLFAIQDIFTQGLLGYWLILSCDSSPGM